MRFIKLMPGSFRFLGEYMLYAGNVRYGEVLCMYDWAAFVFILLGCVEGECLVLFLVNKWLAGFGEPLVFWWPGSGSGSDLRVMTRRWQHVLSVVAALDHSLHARPGRGSYLRVIQHLWQDILGVVAHLRVIMPVHLSSS